MWLDETGVRMRNLTSVFWQFGTNLQCRWTADFAYGMMEGNYVFSKDELFREIWDMDSIGDIATVTVHIKKIREKIEVDTAKPNYIETIWGVGYRFKV